MNYDCTSGKKVEVKCRVVKVKSKFLLSFSPSPQIRCIWGSDWFWVFFLKVRRYTVSDLVSDLATFLMISNRLLVILLTFFDKNGNSSDTVYLDWCGSNELFWWLAFIFLFQVVHSEANSWSACAKLDKDSRGISDFSQGSKSKVRAPGERSELAKLKHGTFLWITRRRHQLKWK